MGWLIRAAALVALGAALLLSMSASKINSSYLLPGHEFKVAPTSKGEIPRFCALTFDDGPDAKYTSQVLAILKDKGVRATFFVVGRHVHSYPEQVKLMAAEGHEVANHSWSHADFTKLSAKQQRAEMDKCSAELEKLGITPHWFRPPYGAFNRTTTRQAGEAGLIPLLWSVDPRDWAEPGESVIISRVLKAVSNGGVVLLHSTHGQTAQALPRLIDKLRDAGYNFVTLSEWQALVTGQQLPVTVAPGLPEQLENSSPGEQNGDSLPALASTDSGTPELVTVPPLDLRPLGTSIGTIAGPGGAIAADSSGTPAAGSEADAGVADNAPMSGPYEIQENPGEPPQAPSEWQFAAPPSITDLLDDPQDFQIPDLGISADDASARRGGPARSVDMAARLAATAMLKWASRIAGGKAAAEEPASAPAAQLEPLRVHSNFRDPEELERWLH